MRVKRKSTTKRNTYRKKKKVAIKKSRVEKPFNSGTMSKAAFFQYIRRLLRKGSMYWKPINNVRMASRIPYIGPNKKRKYSYICSECHLPYSINEINVHHSPDCGSINSFEDIGGFVERLFCTEEHLSVLCTQCHALKHPKIVKT